MMYEKDKECLKKALSYLGMSIGFLQRIPDTRFSDELAALYYRLLTEEIELMYLEKQITIAD